MDAIWWMDIRYNFMYILYIFDATSLFDESNLMSELLKMFKNIGD